VVLLSRGSTCLEVSSNIKENSNRDERSKKILITGGKNSYPIEGYLNDVELINPWVDENKCTKPPDFPLRIDSPTGTNTLICGGRIDGVASTNRCFNLDESQWNEMNNMIEPRWGASTIRLENGSMWVTGGSDGSVATSYTTEIQPDLQGPFDISVNIPNPMFLHCSSKINETHIFLAAGYNHYKSYIIDISSDKFIWIELPSMLNDRWGSACGTVQNAKEAIYSEQDTLLMVAGGAFGFQIGDERDYLTEVFSLETWEWQYGPKIPRPYRYGGYISNKRHPLLMIGGQGLHYTEQSDMFEYQHETNTFEILPGRLVIPRSAFIATEIETDEDC